MIVLEIDSVKEFMQHMFQGSMFDRVSSAFLRGDNICHVSY